MAQTISPLLAGIAALALSLAAAPFSAENPAARFTPRWQNHFAETLDVIKSQKPQLVFLGDSITDELASTRPRFRAVHAVWQQYYACRNALNLGFAGDTTGNVLWRITHGELANIAPKLVVILIGTNDLSPRWDATPQQATNGVQSVVATVHAKLPHAHILLLGLLPRQTRDNRRRQVNRHLAQIDWAPYGARYLNISDVLLKNDAPNPALYLEAPLGRPLLHPNGAGWSRIAAAIEPTIGAILGNHPCG